MATTLPDQHQLTSRSRLSIFRRQARTKFPVTSPTRRWWREHRLRCLSTVTSAGPPSITSLSPSSATAGGAAFTLTVNGTNFASGAVVKWNGVDLSSTFVSAIQLNAAVPASNIASAGTAQVTVAVPVTSGTSNAVTFNIIGSQPVINSGGLVNAASFVPGQPVAPGSIASVFGSSFGSTSAGGVIVQMNGINAPVFASTAQQINFQVPWELTGQTASLVVTVNGQASSPVTVPIAPIAPGIVHYGTVWEADKPPR